MVPFVDPSELGEPEVHSEAWWAERGVAEEVRDARQYVRWRTDDLEPVRDAYAGLGQGQLNTMLRWARQSDGLVIYRHSFEQVPRGELRYVYPEIRPDQAVQTTITWHYHGTPLGESPCHPTSGNALRPADVHTPESMAAHIARDREADDHHGVNSEQVHSHRNMAKYLFPPSATALVPWIHNHRDEWWRRVYIHLQQPLDDDGEPWGPEVSAAERERLETNFYAWLERHRRRYHPDIDAAAFLEGVRELTDSDTHEHSVRIRRTDQQLARRIDVNPLVWLNGGFEPAERVFFVIEGCIKADAILTALLHAGQPPAVFSVPSVSLWEATYPLIDDEGDDENYGGELTGFSSYIGDELAAFAHAHLLGKLVCIVPDADAHTKDEVMTQALLCRSKLRQLGARAEILLPPNERLDQGIKGVDDYLGKGGGTLDGLVWYRKEPPSHPELADWLTAHRGARRWRADALQRAVDTLTALATHAGSNGEYSASVRLLARATSRGPARRRPGDHDPEALEATSARSDEATSRRFQRGIDDLLEIRAINTNRPLVVRQERWLRGRSGSRPRQGLHWDEDGVVITIHPDLRALTQRRSIRDLA